MSSTLQYPVLPAAVSGERRDLMTGVGRLSYYVAGPDHEVDPHTIAPMLLLHSVNAAGSAYEVRPLYERYRERRAVYALDLPGFGFSDRSDRRYRPRLMTDAVHAMVAEIRRMHGTTAIDAFAVSLSSEFLARAASEAPGAFRSLAIVSPTGFDRRAPHAGEPGTTRGNSTLYSIFNFPLWSRGFFHLLTSRPSIRYFLKKTWGSEAIDEGLLAYDYLTTHQPGARHAPYDFVSGYLFSADISVIYKQLTLPVWMTHGVRGDFTDYSWKSEVKKRSNWTIDVLPTGALPYFEMLDVFAGKYDAFLDLVTASRSER
jgi:pimeloyl-ACP methyl ester carboxylesterase